VISLTTRVKIRLYGLRRCNGGYLETGAAPSRSADRIHALVALEDDGITWSPPRRTGIWGYPADVIQLQDGRVLAVYGFRRKPMCVRGCLSDDGLHWDVANEFVIRDCILAPPEDPFYWHIGYPTVAQTPDGTIVVAYHEHSDDEEPIQYMRTSRFRLD